MSTRPIFWLLMCVFASGLFGQEEALEPLYLTKPQVVQFEVGLASNMKGLSLLSDYVTKAASKVPTKKKYLDLRTSLLTVASSLDAQMQNERNFLAAVQTAEKVKVTDKSTVFTLMIYQKEGVYSSSAATEERAFEDLAGYVKEQWAKLFPLIPVPSTNDEMVDQFFIKRGKDESYEIVEHELLR